MIAEKFPELDSLDPQDQLILAGELMLRATDGVGGTPLSEEAMAVIERRLDHYLAHPETGVCWEDLRDRDVEKE